MCSGSLSGGGLNEIDTPLIEFSDAVQSVMVGIAGVICVAEQWIVAAFMDLLAEPRFALGWSLRAYVQLIVGFPD